MKTIADTLGVARSNLVEQVQRSPRRRRPYRKADDAWLLPLVRALVDQRPTYGYRRVGAILNRQVAAALGKPPVNHKRVYRLMRQNGLLLARHAGTGRQRAHEGVVRTLQSNLRRCSDVFEVPCWNGETIRVAFVSRYVRSGSDHVDRHDCRNCRRAHSRSDDRGDRASLRCCRACASCYRMADR